jgi:Uncharacterized conserved protein (DUF2190)
MPVVSASILRSANHLHEGFEHIYSGSTASATITEGQLLEVTGDGTLGPAGAASAAVVGVALTGAASAAPVKALMFGPVLSITSTGAITAGAKVVAGAAGVVATIGANTFEKIVGTALTTAAGNVVRVVMHT